jgi:hypothetical protein
VRKFLLFLWAIAVVAISAPAAIIPELSAVAPSAGGNNTFFYSLALAPNTKLDTTRPFEQAVVIYDFSGYVDGTIGSASGNWVTSVENSGPTEVPFIEAIPGEDDPNIPNLIFRYIGPSIAGPQLAFDVVFADSIYTLTVLDRYQGQGTKNIAPPDPFNQNNLPEGTDGLVSVPQIPEPTTMALMGLGLVGLAVFHRRKG